MSSNQQLQQVQLKTQILELSDTEHRQLFESLKNPVLLKYLERTMEVNANMLLRSPISTGPEQFEYLLEHSRTKGVALLAESLIDIYNEGVLKYGRG